MSQRRTSLTTIQTGHVLITLLVFMIMFISITGAAVSITVINTQAIISLKAGQEAFRLAENGAENALLRLLRDPGYDGETLSLDTGTATINVSGSTTKTITSVGQSGDFQRTVEITAEQSGGTLNITSWSEIP
ncbi:MAG: hypothetical protein U5K77_00160 [Candidatus Saccharibacteria bacterium]|nr:hypothetical protein [Candidatus Saccharibacteria bacterium]